MILLSIYLKYFVTVSFLVSTGSCLQVESLVTVKEGFRAKGTVLQSKQTSSQLDCAHFCLRKEGCLSFNYKLSSKTTGLCELLSDTAGHFDVSQLVNRVGWMHGQIVPFAQNTDKDDTQLKVTFTTLGSKGRTGPRDTLQYHGTPLEGKVQLDKGIQTWILPKTGMYSVTACGASGGNGIKEGGGGWTLGGKGAKIKGLFKLTAGEKLQILVGQQGISNVMGRGAGAAPPGGGGGGTFVIKGDDEPLIIAGGGGGGAGFESVNTSLNGDNGQKTENGTRHGGNNGLGGRRSPNSEGSGGGGYSGDGESSKLCSGGSSFFNGGDGGQSFPGVSDGGFGGGGAATSFPGGGGGYSGGGVEELSDGGKVAGGGGSYNRGTEQDNSVGLNIGDGEVMITLID